MAARVQSELESHLRDYARRPIPVFIRTAAELRQILRQNPFPEGDPALTVFFLDGKPRADATSNLLGRTDEELRAGKREIYVHYPRGMGQSKLVIPAAKLATARNMNTIAKLVEMSS